MMERRQFIKSVIALGAFSVFANKTFAAEPWGYKGPEGPEHWSEIDKHNLACSTGSQQSPIDISGDVQAQLPEIELNWASGGGTMVNNGHTIQIDMPEGSTLSRGGEVYELVQFHFHTPSEHHVHGRSFPMEAHFVHKNAKAGSFGVLAVFLQVGGANKAFAQLAGAFPKDAGSEICVRDVDPKTLLPSSLDYWLYEGSLTTPPCSENVDWMVLKEPLQVSAQDIMKFEAIFQHNARPVALPQRRFILSSS